MPSFTITIQGMSCGHCVAAVKEALDNLETIQSSSVEIGKAIISADSHVDMASVEQALREEGYTVEAVEQDGD